MASEQKTKNKGMLRRWYKLASPSKKLMVAQVITNLLASVSHILQPIFAAFVIANLYRAIEGSGSFTTVYLWLGIGIGNIILRQLVWHINFRIWPYLTNGSYLRIQNKIFSKIMSVKEQGLQQMSAEKLINIVNTDILEVSSLTNTLITRITSVLRIVVFLVLTAVVSWIAALMGVAIVIINYILVDVISKKLAKTRTEILARKDNIVEHFSEIMRARQLARDFGLTQQLKKDYINYNNEYFKKRHQYFRLRSLRENWVFAVWNVLITLSSVFLVYLVHKQGLPVEAYLLATGYLLSCVMLSADALTVFVEFNQANVSTLRIYTLLNMEDKELVQLGKNAGSDAYDEITFNNVSFNKGWVDGEKTGKLNNINLTFPKNTLTVVHGPYANGKRVIFYLLRRKVKADSGVVTVNGIEVSEYSEKAYKNIVNFSSFDPYFFRGSLMKNFLHINPDKKQIYKMCEILKIKGFIETLPNGFDTDIIDEGDNIPQYQKFMFGLATALLSNSRFILIYGVPLMITKSQKKELCEILNKLKRVRTFILILPGEDFMEIADRLYLLEDGTIKRHDVIDRTLYQQVEFDLYEEKKSEGSRVLVSSEPEALLHEEEEVVHKATVEEDMVKFFEEGGVEVSEENQEPQEEVKAEPTEEQVAQYFEEAKHALRKMQEEKAKKEAAEKNKNKK